MRRDVLFGRRSAGRLTRHARAAAAATVAVGVAAAVAPPASAAITERVSVATGGAHANTLDGWTYTSATMSTRVLSHDGRFVAFDANATNLVEGDTNRARDIFVRDRRGDKTTRVSVASDGSQANANSSNPSISADGRYVAFHSDATNLVPGDTNAIADVFVHDRATGTTTRVSVGSAGNQVAGRFGMGAPSISADGRYVAFSGYAAALVPGSNDLTQVYVHDRQTGQTTLASRGADGLPGTGSEPSISDDGRYVAFSAASQRNMMFGLDDTPINVFVHDRQTGQTSRVSVHSGGGHGGHGHTHSDRPSISGDGRYVAFRSIAPGLVEGDTNGRPDIFVHDRETRQTTRVSVAGDGTESSPIDAEGKEVAGDTTFPSISGDGRYVAFQSNATNLVAGDTNREFDVFRHDRQTGETIRVSVAGDGAQAARGSSTRPAISADGRHVAFTSYANNLVAGENGGWAQVYVRDLAAATATRKPTVRVVGKRVKPGGRLVLRTAGIADGRRLSVTWARRAADSGTPHRTARVQRNRAQVRAPERRGLYTLRVIDDGTVLRTAKIRVR
jgi:Tol biopolymer transport system component